MSKELQTDAPRAPLLAGRTALIAAHGLPLGRRLAEGLERHGARVVQVPQADDPEAYDAYPGADLVVHAGAHPEALVPRRLEATPPEAWHAAAHLSALASLHTLQAAHRLQRHAGGTTVVVGPTVALVGAPGLVPLVTLAEAQRTLVKAAARQWGRHGMRLHWVGIAAPLYAPELANAALPPTPELGPPPPALGRVPQPETDLADLIAWLAGDGAHGLTGTTFNLDGGDWMVP